MSEAHAHYPAEKMATLRALSDQALSETLLDEAYTLIPQLPQSDQQRVGDNLLHICWKPTPEEVETGEEFSEERKQVFNYLIGIVYGQITSLTTGEELEPKEAAERYRRGEKAEVYAKVGEAKQRADLAIEELATTNVGDPESSVMHTLIGLCEAQVEAGVLFEGDFVRESALGILDEPLRRALVLFNNVLAGDEQSFELAIEELRSDKHKSQMGRSWEADQLVRLVSKFLPKTQSLSIRQTMRDQATGALAYLSTWNGWYNEPHFTTRYVLLCGQLAAAVRTDPSF